MTRPRPAAAADHWRCAAGDSQITVCARGAELSAWTFGGRDLLWCPDPAVWRHTAPILFPIVGRLRDDHTTVGGRHYRIPIHGFAAARRFALVDRGADRLHLRLRDTRKTRAAFPFGFRLDVEYRLQALELTLVFAVANTGGESMPYALGFHPGFAWPDWSDTGQFAVHFERDEARQVPQITGDGLLGRTTRDVPLRQRSLVLAPSLFEDGALVFRHAASRRLELPRPGGGTIALAADNFDHWALWARPPAPFLCAEVLTGHGDYEDFRGALQERPSMRLLAPGAQASHALTLQLVG